jgi:hypothetical protein
MIPVRRVVLTQELAVVGDIRLPVPLVVLVSLF